MKKNKIMNQRKINLDPEKVKIFHQERSKFLEIKSRIAELIEPRIFRLILEDSSNVRNSIIISGALATLGLLIFNNKNVSVNRTLLEISIIGFLLVIIFYSIFSEENIRRSVNKYRNKLEDQTGIAEEGEDVVNDWLDGKIKTEEAEKKILEVYKKIEYKIIRKRTAKEKKEEKGCVILGKIGNVLFISSIVVLILSFFVNQVVIFLTKIFT